MNVVFILACFVFPAHLVDKGEDASGLHQAFFQKHCVSCHGPERQEGHLRLDNAGAVQSNGWNRVYEQLADNLMPPEDQTQPTATERQQVIEYALQQAVKDAEPRASGLRRLNRREYTNTVRDLLGLGQGVFDPGEYIYEDSVDEGFDTRAESLVISNELLLEYASAAEKSLRHALFSIESRPPSSTVVHVDLNRVQGTSRRYINNHRDYVICRSGGKAKLYDGTAARAMKFPGRYKISVTASAVDRDYYPERFAPAKGAVLMGFGVAADERESVSNKGLLQRTFKLADDVEQTFEFDAWIDKGYFPYLSFVNGSSKPITQVRSGVRRKKLPRNAASEPYSGPGIRVSEFTIEGPFYDQWPPTSVRKTFDLDKSVELSVEAERKNLVLRFARRAFRRQVAQDEILPYLNYLDEQYANSGNWSDAVLKTLTAMMTSLDFLYIQEKAGSLDDHALASRLSYFFWSSMPDDELLQLAETGELSEAAVLNEQVLRLLADERSQQFCDSFARQWLSLDKLGTMRPDALGEFRVYYRQNLETAMLEETHRFFRYVLFENKSVKDFLDSDYTFVNSALAELYGIPYNGAGEFVRTSIPPTVKRGGLLGQGSILTLTANGVETSPIERGVWVLANLLGTPPPPPPQAVPALTPDLNGTTTVREMLLKHRSDSACAVCHVRIDPPGFALEGFDPIGRERTKYSPRQSISTDGTYQGQQFADVTQLKRIIAKSSLRLFARNLIIRIAEYAKGRDLVASDYSVVESLLEDAAQNEFRFRDMIVAMANSDLMRMR